MRTAAAAAAQPDNVEAEAQRGDNKGAPLALALAAGLTMILLTTSSSGAALLVWWAVHFHSDDRQLWMVPVGLVLFCSPIVACLSIFLTSDFFPGSEFQRRKAMVSIGRVGAGDGGVQEIAVAPAARTSSVLTASGVASGDDVKRG